MSFGDSDYIEAAESVHVSPPPDPIRRGDRWFRRWTVTAPSPEGLGEFVLPSPVREDMIIASVVPDGGDRIVVEIGERQERLSADALTYAAMIVSELRCRLGEGTAVDGDRRHTLFLLVRWDCDRNKSHP